MKIIFALVASTFLLAACQTTGDDNMARADRIGSAPEMMGEPVKAEQIAALVYGKRIQDVNRSDHWVEFSAGGTAVGASRGKTFDMTYELEDGAWCRVIRPEGADSKSLDRYTKCQSIRYDGDHLYFYDKDGTLASKYVIEG